MKRWRRGFIRWRRREGPCGSHQLEARALKWETSVGSTEDACGADIEKERAGVDRGEAGLLACWNRRERRLAGRRRRRACASVILVADMTVRVENRECPAGTVQDQTASESDPEEDDVDVLMMLTSHTTRPCWQTTTTTTTTILSSSTEHRHSQFSEVHGLRAEILAIVSNHSTVLARQQHQ